MGWRLIEEVVRGYGMEIILGINIAFQVKEGRGNI